MENGTSYQRPVLRPQLQKEQQGSFADLHPPYHHYDTLKSRSFDDRFKIYVAAPSTWEYRSVDDQGNPKGVLMTNIDQLSKDFLLQKEAWGSLTPILFSGSISEGLNFVIAIFRNADKQTLEDFLDFSIRALSNIPVADRNIGIIVGTLSENGAAPQAQRVFEVVLQSEDLKYLAFAIARTTQLPYQLIQELLSGVPSYCLFSAAHEVKPPSSIHMPKPLSMISGITDQS